MPLGRSRSPSPDNRLINRPPTKDPTSPATNANVQSILFADLPKISCAPAPTSMPNKMSPRISMIGSIDEQTVKTSRQQTSSPSAGNDEHLARPSKSIRLLELSESLVDLGPSSIAV